MPSAITISDSDVLLVDRHAARFHARRRAGGRRRRRDRAAGQRARGAASVNVVADPGLASAGPRFLRLVPSGARPFEAIEDAPYGDQALWPDHCVQGTPGAALHQRISRIDRGAPSSCARACIAASIPIPPSSRPTARRRPGSPRSSRRDGIKRVFVCGLATDYCVAWSALDARAAGFETFVIEDACRAIDANGSLAARLGADERGRGRRIESRGNSGLTRPASVAPRTPLRG